MISLVGVSKRYDMIPIVHSISCTIPEGSITLLVGENGAGKSTLLRLLAEIETPTTGTITYQENTTIGYVGHTTALYPTLTAMENLLFWTKLYGIPTTILAIEEVLHQVHLYEVRNRYIGLFSRGMAQRIAIARVLLQNPSVILLDEPSTGLDTSSIQMLYNIITEARQQGKTIIWITHSIATDIHYADHLLCIKNKTCDFFGTRKEYTIYANQPSGITREVRDTA